MVSGHDPTQSEIVTRQVRDGEETDQRESQPYGDRGAEAASEDLRHQLERVFGETRKGRAVAGIVGGMFSRLIRDAERRLGNAEACLTWYENEKKEALADLNELKELHHLFRTQLEQEPEQSGNDE